MTFLEALRTGKPLRRSSWWNGQGRDRWLRLDAEGEWTWSDGKPANPATRSDLLASDWEVAP